MECLGQKCLECLIVVLFKSLKGLECLIYKMGGNMSGLQLLTDCCCMFI